MTLTTTQMLDLLKIRLGQSQSRGTEDAVRPDLLIHFINLGQDQAVMWLKRNLLHELDASVLKQSLDEDGAFDVSNLSIFNGVNGIDHVKEWGDDYCYKISYKEYIDHSDTVKQFFSDRPRYYIRGSKLYFIFADTTSITSGNISSGVEYKVTGYGRIRYNSANYEITEIFTGASGATAFAVINPTLTLGVPVDFVDGGAGNDIIRASANQVLDVNWVTKGMEVGDTFTVKGSASNSGTYTVVEVSEEDLEVATGSFTAEVQSTPTIKITSITDSTTGVIVKAQYIDLWYLHTPDTRALSGESLTYLLNGLYHNLIVDFAEAEYWRSTGQADRYNLALQRALGMIQEYNGRHPYTESQSIIEETDDSDIKIKFVSTS